MASPDRQRLEMLARKWLEGSITPEEQEEFSAWYNHDQDIPAFIPPASAESEEEHREKILANILRGRQQRKRFAGWWKPGIAAALLLMAMGYGIYLLIFEYGTQAAGTETAISRDVPPGGEKATLTFDDGRSVSLDEQQNGVLKYDYDRGVRISNEDGMVVYEATGPGQGKTGYNIIATPRGGQYSLRLPDGSIVWLNAASSLRYPTRFTGSSRTVELNGEAFFDIVPVAASDKPGAGKIPFIVNVHGKQTVKVLGTRFNINSYEDELSVKTTLVEGSVEVLARKGASALLKPNQQSDLASNGRLTVKEHADIEEALAWKNGQILFRDTDIRVIMRQIARWYDVDVVYQDDIPERLFNGGISRNSKLSSLLEILETTSGIRFKVEGKQIIVTL